MLVYGDQRELARPSERLRALSRELAEVARAGPGLTRHARLVSALIRAGQLVQGVADEGFPTRELDRLLHGLATSTVRSRDSGFAEIGSIPRVPDPLLPEEVSLRVPEGFAFYTLYPESYIVAARKLRLLGPPKIIGIRSIGTTLGAVTAAALGAPPATTVRPFGDPFERRVRLPEQLLDPVAHYVIVDEGPGLSGSSFGAVADWLQARGVPLDRIAFLPSHGGDLGREASDEHRQRWCRAQRVPACFDPSFLSAKFGELDEFTGGGPFQRQKYLARRNGERILLKFAGLGEIGERKLGMARALHASGFTAEPMGLVHGFIVERWHADARRLDSDRPVVEIGRYIGARARLFPAPDESGATIEDLLQMCRRNIALGLGDDAARQIERFNWKGLSGCVRRTRTDNKLDAQEWLRIPNGALLKADAVDHHQAHDLVGCQDMAWDVAGAIVELDLDASETACLIQATGHDLVAELLELYIVAYAAFRLGQAELAFPGTAAASRYRMVLADHLQERT